MNFIVNEMMRVPEACVHVVKTKPPVILCGMRSEIEALPKLLREKASSHRDTRGRKQRSDTPLLMGVIFSFPAKIIDDAYFAWEQNTIDFARRHFGHQVAAIVRHEDEAFPHLHVLVHNDGASVHALSPGYLNKKRSRSSLIEFHDAYQAEVGVHHGLARTGLRRERETSTRVYKRMKAEIEAAQMQMNALQTRAEKIKIKNDEDAAHGEILRKNLIRTNKALESSITELQHANAQRQTLEKRQRALDAKEFALQMKIDALDEIKKEQLFSRTLEKMSKRSMS